LFSFLKSKSALVVTLVLLTQAAVVYSSQRTEKVPASLPLSNLPLTLGPWRFVSDSIVDDETKDVLKADDLLLRDYRDSSNGRKAGLFVAAFRTQRNGQVPHSPKNCLPGAGWTQLSSDDYPVNVGAAQPIVVNRYIVQHGEERSLVMYWYQSRERVVASEYTAKFWVMADAIRLNRTDTALVRVFVDIVNGNFDEATQTAVSFVQNFFGPLHRVLPQ
jgi:EpsI family protein